jgi:hypothetical protein
MMRRPMLCFAAWFSLSASPVPGQVVCPPIDFLAAYSVDVADGPFMRLLERRPDGDYLARVYERRLPFELADNEPGFGRRFVNCVPAPPSGGPAIPPPARPLGAGSTEVLYIPDVGNGAPGGAWSVFNGNAIWVFEGTPERVFTRRTEYPVADSREGLLSADYDGDRIPDIAVLVATSAGAGGLAILKGNGDGTFQPPTQHGGLQNFPTGMAQSDFNGDGAMDFAIAAPNAGNVRILLGNGNGTFRDGQSIDTVGPFTVTAGDVNGDGVVDLVAGGDGITVLLGRGDGGFGDGAAFPAGGPVRYIALGDLDEDGDMDAAVANETLNSV